MPRSNQIMASETDMTILDKIITKYQIGKETHLDGQSLARINAIDESKTFRYEPLENLKRNYRI